MIPLKQMERFGCKELGKLHTCFRWIQPTEQFYIFRTLSATGDSPSAASCDLVDNLFQCPPGEMCPPGVHQMCPPGEMCPPGAHQMCPPGEMCRGGRGRLPADPGSQPASSLLTAGTERASYFGCQTWVKTVTAASKRHWLMPAGEPVRRIYIFSQSSH